MIGADSDAFQMDTANRAEAPKSTPVGEIQSGAFADEWIAESEAGRPNYRRLQEEGKAHPIEEIGAQLRAMMPFISAGKQRVADVSGG